MRAVVTRTPGAFVVEEIERRAPGAGEAVVRLRSAGICQTDISLAGGAFGQPFPVVLGHEGAGEIIELGDDTQGFSVGDHVLLKWIHSCGTCFHCARGETYICANRRSARQGGSSPLHSNGESILVGLGTGTFAEETTISTRSLVAIPHDLPFDVAALMGCAVSTGYGAAVHSGKAAIGESVLVIGCGAVGLSAVQGARIAGASRIVAVDPLESRRAIAREVGATHVAAPDENVQECAGGPAFDLVIDAVAASATIRSAWDAARRGGRIVVVGAGKPEAEVAFSAYELFHDEKSLRGSFAGSTNIANELPILIELWRSGQLRLDPLIDGHCSLDELADAAEQQRSGKATRVMVAL